MNRTPIWLSGLALSATLSLASVASAQTVDAPSRQSSAMPSGLFFRTGLTVGSFDLQRLTFRPSRGSRGSRDNILPGKEFLQNGLLGGAAFGLQADSRWFYVRVAADVYQSPAVTREPQVRASAVTVGWVGFGPRLVVGPLAFLAGVRLGALLTNVNSEDPTTRTRQEFDAVEGIYAADLGVQLRPFRWLEIDTAVSQDFGALAGTTFSLTANFGWSRGPR